MEKNADARWDGALAGCEMERMFRKVKIRKITAKKGECRLAFVVESMLGYGLAWQREFENADECASFI